MNSLFNIIMIKGILLIINDMNRIKMNYKQNICRVDSLISHKSFFQKVKSPEICNSKTKSYNQRLTHIFIDFFSYLHHQMFLLFLIILAYWLSQTHPLLFNIDINMTKQNLKAYINLCTIIKLIMFRIFFNPSISSRFCGLHRILYNYNRGRKVINIRAQPKQTKTQINNQRNPIEGFQKTKQRQSFQNFGSSKITSKSYTLSSQEHSINKSIKDVTTLHQLFKIHNKYKNRLSINQYLNLFEKLAYLQHFGQNNKEQLKKVGITESLLTQNYINVIDGLKKSLFSASQAPQIYINFMHTLSKCHNQFIFSRGFQDIFIKILKNQLLIIKKESTKGKSNKKQQIDDKKESEQKEQEKQIDKEKEENYVSTSQVISIFNNLKLAQSLLRILNHRTKQFKSQNTKLMVSLLRQVVTFLHTPSTPNQINNRSLFQLINQYIILYPHLKLSNGVLKSLIRQCLARIKYEDILKKIKNKKKLSKESQQREQQVSIVNSIKKLLLLQKIYIQQTKTSALRKQILQTKSNNIQFSSFFKIQQKLHSYIVELLPKCKIYSEAVLANNQSQQNQIQQVHGPLWQHIQLIPMLKSHVKLLMIETPIEILSKSDLLTSTYDQYEAFIRYLLNIYIYSTDLNKSNKLEVRKRQKFSQILSNSYSLLYILMKKQLQIRIPSVIIHKSINGLLLTELIGNFDYLAKELKMLVVWSLLKQKNNSISNQEKNITNSKSSLKVDNKLITELISSLLISHKQNEGQLKNDNRITTGSWYLRLFAGNPQYLQYMNTALREKDLQMAIQSFEAILKDIDEYAQQTEDFTKFPDNQSKRQIKSAASLLSHQQLGRNMGRHLKFNTSNHENFNKIISFYEKESGKNSIYSEKQFKQMKKNTKFETKISLWETEIKQEEKIQQRNERKLNLCYSKTEIILNFIDQYFGDSNNEMKINIYNKIKECYERERQFLQHKQKQKSNYQIQISSRINLKITAILGEDKSQQQEQKMEKVEKTKQTDNLQIN